jgi:hypothetical protein
MITRIIEAVSAWLDRLDPGTHRRIKGLRLVTAFGIAWMASTMPGIALRSPPTPRWSSGLPPGSP